MDVPQNDLEIMKAIIPVETGYKVICDILTPPHTVKSVRRRLSTKDVLSRNSTCPNQMLSTKS